MHIDQQAQKNDTYTEIGTESKTANETPEAHNILTSSVQQEVSTFPVDDGSRRKFVKAKKGPNEVRFAKQLASGSETQETIVMTESSTAVIAANRTSESTKGGDDAAVGGAVASSTLSPCGEISTRTATAAATTASSQQQQASALRQRDRSERREMRATIRMAVIIGVFCAMWLGFFSVYVARGVGGGDGSGSRLLAAIPHWLDAFLFWLGYANSTVNPILYAVFNVEFRRAFQHIVADFCCRCCPQLRRRLMKHQSHPARIR